MSVTFAAKLIFSVTVNNYGYMPWVNQHESLNGQISGYKIKSCQIENFLERNINSVHIIT